MGTIDWQRGVFRLVHYYTCFNTTQVGKILAGVGALCLLHLGISFLIFDASRFHHPSLVTVSVVFSSAALMLVAPASSHVLTILSDNSSDFSDASLMRFIWFTGQFLCSLPSPWTAPAIQRASGFFSATAVGAAWLLTERLENPIGSSFLLRRGYCSRARCWRLLGLACFPFGIQH